MSDDARTAETALPLRVLPRRVQATIGSLLLIASATGIDCFRVRYRIEAIDPYAEN